MRNSLVLHDVRLARATNSNIVGSLSGYTEGEQAYNPPKVMVPTEVRFDHHERLVGEGRVKRYCFAVAASANHTAALVFDLAEDEFPPGDPNQNALRGVSSSLVCNDS